MKRFLLFAVAVLAFVGCNEMFEDEVGVLPVTTELTTIYASFDDDTRVSFTKNNYIKWDTEDKIIVYYDISDSYPFSNSVEEAMGTLKDVVNSTAIFDCVGTIHHLFNDLTPFNGIYAKYPYGGNIEYWESGKSDHIEEYLVVSTVLPDVQKYTLNSFDKDANLMVAASPSIDNTSLFFKNVCGYLRLKLYGDIIVKSIQIDSNYNEDIGGGIAEIKISCNEDPEIVVDAYDFITLDCGAGVKLNKEHPLDFWFVIPPVQIEGGINIRIVDIYGNIFYKSTNKPITIERNVITPMAAIEVTSDNIDEERPANNEIWYYLDYVPIGTPPGPNDSNAFDANIVSNKYVNGKGVITFDGDVTMIGDCAFESNGYTRIVLPDSVTTIGERAFYFCHSLTSITIGDSVTTIGDYAFQYCYRLTSVTIPDSVTTIGNVAFASCYSLASVTIGDSVTTIGVAAFSGCGSLTSVTIPDSVTTIGERAFDGCHSLASVTIGDSVTTIGDWAFSLCDNLASVTIGDSVTTIGESAFEDCSSLTSVTIPDSVTTIGDDAFEYCNNLTSVTIGDSVTTIGDYAFGGCRSLTSVTIGDSVTTIGENAFYNCWSLTNVYITDLTTWCNIEFINRSSCPLGFGEKTNLYLNGELLTDLVIPDSVTTIGNYAFFWCSNLTSVTIGDSVTTIGNSSFSGCDSLTSVTIGDNVTTIGEWAFDGCSSLTSVTIPDSVTTIGYGAFSSCSSLTSVTIGDSVTTIGGSAFSDCYSLTDVTIPDSVTTIGDYAFDGCCSLTSVTIGDSVITIGNRAFSDCNSLTDVTIPDSVTTIGDWAFSGCKSLTSVTIPDSVTTIERSAFASCDSLKEFKGEYASDDGRCLIIDGTLNSFAPAGLTEYTIPDSVTTIGDWALSDCNNLTSVTIPDSVTTIGERAFASCDSLTSVTIGDSVTTIGDYAFASCGSLTSVIIGDSVTTIGDYAFDRCSIITSVYCKATTPPSIGYGVFDYVIGRKFYVPTASVNAYKTADGWSDYARYIVGYDF